MFALGILSIELCLDIRLNLDEQLCQSHDRDQQECLLYNLAKIKIDEVREKMGRTYAEAVARCLECQRQFDGLPSKASSRTKSSVSGSSREL